MNIPNINDCSKGFIFVTNANDKDMIDICTLTGTGKLCCWGSIMNDAFLEAGLRSANPIVWEGLPEDKKTIISVTVQLQLVDYTLKQ